MQNFSFNQLTRALSITVKWASLLILCLIAVIILPQIVEPLWTIHVSNPRQVRKLYDTINPSAEERDSILRWGKGNIYHPGTAILGTPLMGKRFAINTPDILKKFNPDMSWVDGSGRVWVVYGEDRFDSRGFVFALDDADIGNVGKKNAPFSRDNIVFFGGEQ